MTVPGVGALIAVTFTSAVDDPARFPRSKDVGAHFGLTPRKYQSGETDVTGAVSRVGDAMVRTALYEGGPHPADARRALLGPEALGAGGGQAARHEAGEGGAGAQAGRHACTACGWMARPSAGAARQARSRRGGATFGAGSRSAPLP